MMIILNKLKRMKMERKREMDKKTTNNVMQKL